MMTELSPFIRSNISLLYNILSVTLINRSVCSFCMSNEMHYIGIPKPTPTLVAYYKILSECFFENTVENCIVGMF